jgi:peptidoglycan/LPS O-acetylase OafA/YrhL
MTAMAPGTTTLPTIRNPGIDVLRGLSILLVVLHHISLRLPLKATAVADVLPHRLVAALSWNGWSAVFLFFVISGFLIALHALQRHGSLARVDLRAFYVRRAARILPLLLALLAVLAVLHAAGATDYAVDKPGQSLPGALFAALTLHLNWYEAVHGWLPGNWDVLWSLSIEEAFYLGFPLVCLLVPSPRLLFAILAVLALSLPWQLSRIAQASEIWQEKAYLPGMAAIAMGICAALLANRFRVRPGVATILRGAGITGLAATLLFGPWLRPAIGDGTMLVLTAATACLLFGLHHGSPARSWPGLGWLRSLGRLSYEIYLSHMFVVFTAVAAFRAAGGESRDAWWLYPPVVLACWLLGEALARTLTGPADRMLRRRGLRRDPSPPVQASPVPQVTRSPAATLTATTSDGRG